MINYVYYAHIFISLVCLLGMFRGGVSYKNIATSFSMFLLSFLILKNYPLVYLACGALLAVIMGFFAPTSENFKSKDSFFRDLGDIAVTFAMIAVSFCLWMQIICINLCVDPRNFHSE